MHRAVAARLMYPRMSLLEALLYGGFRFPDGTEGTGKSDRNIFDADGVVLCQRKNQLSRRLRLAKQRQEEGKRQQQQQMLPPPMSMGLPAAGTGTGLSGMLDTMDRESEKIQTGGARTLQNMLLDGALPVMDNGLDAVSQDLSSLPLNSAMTAMPSIFPYRPLLSSALPSFSQSLTELQSNLMLDQNLYGLVSHCNMGGQQHQPDLIHHKFQQYHPLRIPSNSIMFQFMQYQDKNNMVSPDMSTESQLALLSQQQQRTMGALQQQQQLCPLDSTALGVHAAARAGMIGGSPQAPTLIPSMPVDLTEQVRY